MKLVKKLHVTRLPLQVNHRCSSHQGRTRNRCRWKRLDLPYLRNVDSQGNVVPTANNLVLPIAWSSQLVGVDNGEQASRERYKAQPDGSGFAEPLTVKGLPLLNQLSKQVNSL